MTYIVVIDDSEGNPKTVKECQTLPEARKIQRRWKITLGLLPEWQPRILDGEGREVEA